MWLYLVWMVKWPALWVLLYWAMGDGQMTPESLCMGLGVVPATVTVLAVGAAVVELRRDRVAPARPGAEGQR